MLEVKEWKWEKVKARDKKETSLFCPYCNTKVRVDSDTRMVDTETGVIKYHICRCPECYMPITVGLDGRIIPPPLFLPFSDVQHLPVKIEKLYYECRKSFSDECYYSAILVARTMLMYIAADLGAQANQNFDFYVKYLEQKQYISQHNMTWVDKIRKLGNHYTHELDEATKEEANKAVVFIQYLLKTVYELPQMAK